MKTEIVMSTVNDLQDTFTNQPFKDLNKILKKKRKKSPPKQELPTVEQTPSDEEIYSEAMKEVDEITKFREMPVYHKRAGALSKATTSDDDALKALEEIVKGKRRIHLPDVPEYVEWIDSNYRDGILENLHQGKYSIQDCLDLHGAILEEAEEEVEKFLKESIRRNFRCVKLVYGRGLRSPNGPVLKGAVLKGLLYRFRKYIIAFVSARQCDGGLGALYVLLK